MLSKIERWLWITWNKKQPKKYAPYMGIAVTWAGLGVLSFMGLLFILLGISHNEPGRFVAIIVGLIVIIATTLLGISAFKRDKEIGYYNALADKNLEDWHKKRKKYGLE